MPYFYIQKHSNDHNIMVYFNDNIIMPSAIKHLLHGSPYKHILSNILLTRYLLFRHDGHMSMSNVKTKCYWKAPVHVLITSWLKNKIIYDIFSGFHIYAVF